MSNVGSSSMNRQSGKPAPDPWIAKVLFGLLLTVLIVSEVVLFSGLATISMKMLGDCTPCSGFNLTRAHYWNELSSRNACGHPSRNNLLLVPNTAYPFVRPFCVSGRAYDEHMAARPDFRFHKVSQAFPRPKMRLINPYLNAVSYEALRQCEDPFLVGRAIP